MNPNRNAMNFSEDFKQALQDYCMLLEKRYPQKTVLELVATRYNLNHFERSMLYRGVSPAGKAEKRRKKRLEPEAVEGKVLHIDLFNALFTIAAYLRGYPVYVANDGILRDASESHGCEDWITHLEKSLDLVMDHLAKAPPAKALFYIDKPMDHCRRIVERIHEHCRQLGLDHEIILHDSPDHLLEKANGGILASSDSMVIDRSDLPVMDLPGAVLQSNFNKHFLQLNDLINN